MYSYPEDLIEFAAEMGISLVGIGTRSGQALAYLAQPEMRGGADWVNRESAENFFREQGMSCDDAIQPFNKPNGKNRLKLMDADRGLYSLKYPYEIKANDKQAIITGTIARPSSPSVKLTALELPTMTKIPKGK